MDDDWQTEAFTQKRIPRGRGKGRGKGKGAAVFDVKKTFGVYTLGGNALERAGDAAAALRVLEIHGLDDSGEGLVGSFSGTGVASGRAILSGNRKVLERIVADSDEDVDIEHAPNETENPDQTEVDRFQAFEKNSFRSPKFWMQWKAPIAKPDDAQSSVETNRAYVVFSGNDCKAFKGTISSTVLGWRDVAITGRKASAKTGNCELRWENVEVVAPHVEGRAEE